ncbi:btb/poz domain-containing protein [Anaeramoeba flamelloides]|uniref:Btb/poz domain-containing protein n=1 Tax=Anaeramoeba flamelloides TaxID=1746091 RepID=A0AAV7YNT9_9EUKA|nr:btb/poz domain-containing protein [Anaeramoeba flamelloides]
MSKVKVFQKQLNPFSRKWKKIFDKRIEKISYGCSNGNILVWKKKNILDIYQKENLYKSAHENSSPESGSESDNYYPDEYKEKNVIQDEDEDEKVQDIKSGQDTSLILTRSGFVYYLQEYYYSSYWKNKGEDSFEILIKEVDGTRSSIKVVGGTDSTLVLSNELALYVWGTLSDSKHLKPTEIKLPKYFNQYPSEFLSKNLMISYKFSDDTILVYLKNFRRKTFKDDFKRLFQSKKFCDSKLKINRGENGTKNKKENNLKIEIPIHKLLIELRTDRKINEIQQIIYRENFSKKEIRRFLKWIYYDDQKNQKLLEKIFLSLKMAFPPKNNLKKDLKRLFKEEETKDFMLLFKKRCGKKKKKIKTQTKKKVTLSNNEKNNDNDNDNQEDDEIYGKIRVHKLILFTRSELFSGMFENLNEVEKTITSIRDYTNKSEESLQLLIKYLYTDKLRLKGKKNINIKAVIEELHDSVDYYQLNIHSNLPNELNNLKNLKVK